VLPTNEWAIDAKMESLAKAVLEEGQRLQPESATYLKPLVVASISEGSGPLSKFKALDINSLQIKLKGFDWTKRYDALLILARHNCSDQIGRSNQTLEGMGFYTKAFPPTAAPYLCYTSTLLDGTTFTVIRSGRGFIKKDPNLIPSLTDKTLPHKIVDPSHFVENAKELKAIDKELIQRTIAELIAESVPGTLRSLTFARE